MNLIGKVLFYAAIVVVAGFALRSFGFNLDFLGRNSNTSGTTLSVNVPTMDDILGDGSGTTRLEPRSGGNTTVLEGPTTMDDLLNDRPASQPAVSLMQGVDEIHDGAPVYRGDCIHFDGLSTGVSGANLPNPNRPANDQRTLMLADGYYWGQYKATAYRGLGACQTN